MAVPITCPLCRCSIAPDLDACPGCGVSITRRSQAQASTRCPDCSGWGRPPGGGRCRCDGTGTVQPFPIVECWDESGRPIAGELIGPDDDVVHLGMDAGSERDWVVFHQPGRRAGSTFMRDAWAAAMPQMKSTIDDAMLETIKAMMARRSAGHRAR